MPRVRGTPIDEKGVIGGADRDVGVVSVSVHHI